MQKFIVGNPEEDFFEQNPHLGVIGVFKEIRMTMEKEDASKTCWSVYLLEDPDSKLWNIPKEDRSTEVKDNYYKLDYDNLLVQNLIVNYPTLCIPKEKRMFKIHSDMLDDLTMHYKSLDLSVDKEFERYLKIADKLPKMWDAMDKIKSRMFAEGAQSGTKGSVTLSPSEKRRSRKK